MNEKSLKYAHTRFAYNYLTVIIQLTIIKVYRCLDLNTKYIIGTGSEYGELIGNRT